MWYAVFVYLDAYTPLPPPEKARGFNDPDHFGGYPAAMVKGGGGLDIIYPRRAFYNCYYSY